MRRTVSNVDLRFGPGELLSVRNSAKYVFGREESSVSSLCAVGIAGRGDLGGVFGGTRSGLALGHSYIGLGRPGTGGLGLSRGIAFIFIMSDTSGDDSGRRGEYFRCVGISGVRGGVFFGSVLLLYHSTGAFHTVEPGLNAGKGVDGADAGGEGTSFLVDGVDGKGF